MVPGPHTVIDPLAVVVKATHTLVTNVAVARVSPTKNLTGGAQDIRVKLLHQLKKRYRRSALQVTRFAESRHKEENIREDKQASHHRYPAILVHVRKHK